MSHEETIKHIVDFHLKKDADIGANQLPIKIEAEMADPNQDPDEEWRAWHSIDSKVNDNDILSFEKRLGYKLPSDYKAFLKYKHFYSLYISDVSFCSHPVKKWMEKQIEMIFDGYPTEYLIDKGYIPFADWSDLGLYCFNTQINSSTFNYPIVLWDHERPDEVETKYSDFYDMMIAIDAEDKDLQLED